MATLSIKNLPDSGALRALRMRLDVAGPPDVVKGNDVVSLREGRVIYEAEA